MTAATDITPIPQHTAVILDRDALLAFHTWCERHGQKLVELPAHRGKPAAWTLKPSGQGPYVPIQLTRREFQVLVCISRGMSNTHIARELYLGLNTVKTHVKALFAKLEVSDRAAAVDIAHRRGLLGGSQ